jgi:hypothetical protein
MHLCLPFCFSLFQKKLKQYFCRCELNCILQIKKKFMCEHVEIMFRKLIVTYNVENCGIVIRDTLLVLRRY